MNPPWLLWCLSVPASANGWMNPLGPLWCLSVPVRVPAALYWVKEIRSYSASYTCMYYTVILIMTASNTGKNYRLNTQSLRKYGDIIYITAPNVIRVSNIISAVTTNTKTLLTRLRRSWNPSKEYRERHRGKLKRSFKKLTYNIKNVKSIGMAKK